MKIKTHSGAAEAQSGSAGNSSDLSQAMAAMIRSGRNAAVLGEHAARNGRIGLTGAFAMPKLANLENWSELAAMQSEVARRVGDLQKLWFEGLSSASTRAAESRRANTISKAVEQELDLVQQMTAIASEQVMGWATLLEDVQVGFGFWISRKLDDDDGPSVAGG